jgi:hypothetical protein
VRRTYSTNDARVVLVGDAPQERHFGARKQPVRTDLPNLRARLANAHGDTLMRAKDYEGARDAYQEATEHANDHALPWAGLAAASAKLARWRQALEAALHALELEPDGCGPRVYRSLGLAATALGDWPHARSAWRELRLPVSEGEGPIEEDFGLAAVRVNQTRRPTEVWCHRIDPVRARIVAVPPPETGHAYGDLLFHDTESSGERVRQTESCPLFDCLHVGERSQYDTWIARVAAPSAADLLELASRLGAVQAILEDWTASPQFSVPWRAWATERRIGIASRGRSFLQAVDAWREERAGRTFDGPELALSRSGS